jgi:hypothetical protein
MKSPTPWLIGLLLIILCLWTLGTYTVIMTEKQAPVYQIEVTILPSPVHYMEGKRSKPGVLSPETILAIELQTTKELFSGELRDPFERLK